MISMQCTCGRKFNFKDSAVGKPVRCPECGTRLQVPKQHAPAVRTHTAEIVEQRPWKKRPRADIHVSVEQSKVTNSLGISSLVLGILAFLLCWIPLIGLVSLPLSLLGVVLATVGCIVAALRGGAGVGYPIAGMGVSGLAAAVTIAITYVIGSAAVETAKEMDKVAKIREERANVKASDAAPAVAVTSPAAEEAKDADTAAGTRSPKEPPPDQAVRAGRPARFGNAVYNINSATIGKVKLTRIGDDYTSQNDLLRVEIAIQNATKNKKLEFISYSNTRASFLTLPRPALTDNFDNSYKRVDFGIGTRPWGQVNQAESIYPDKVVTEVLVFEPPLENATSLRLELPSMYIVDEPKGTITFDIPMSFVNSQTSERPEPTPAPEAEPAPVAATEPGPANQPAPPEPEKEPAAEDEPTKVTAEERAEKQAMLKLQLAEKFQFSDPLKAKDYARQAIRLAPDSETAKKAQDLIDSL